MTAEVKLPEDWILAKIGDVCLLNPKEKLEDELEIGFMPMNGVPNNYFSACKFESRKWLNAKKGFTQFRNGDAIFAKITPCFENSKAAVIQGFPNGWGAGSTEYYVLRPIANAVNPKLLFALVKTQDFLINGALNMSGSVGHKRVPKDFVVNYPLPFPPIAEQKVIADKLDTLLTQVETTKARLERIPQILKRFRQSVLAAAVSGKLTEEWRETSAFGTKLFRDSKTIADICLVITDGEHITPPVTAKGIPLLSAKDVRDGYIDFSNPKYVSEAFAEQSWKRCNPSPGDCLIVSRGATVGRISPVNLETRFCLMGSVILLRPNLNLITSGFLRFFLCAIDTQKELRLSSGATAQAAIYLRDVKMLKIKLPPLEEQTEIVRRVEQLFAYADIIEQQVQNALTRVNNLTQSILAKAFRGELTEQWRKDNPDLISGDNSAEALLEKIKAEREAIKPEKKTQVRKMTA